MILYTFECTQCAHVFDGEKKLQDENLFCPYCGGETEIIIAKKPTVILKGIGWHKNDYNEFGPYNK